LEVALLCRKITACA